MLWIFFLFPSQRPWGPMGIEVRGPAVIARRRSCCFLCWPLDVSANGESSWRRPPTARGFRSGMETVAAAASHPSHLVFHPVVLSLSPTFLFCLPCTHWQQVAPPPPTPPCKRMWCAAEQVFAWGAKRPTSRLLTVVPHCGRVFGRSCMAAGALDRRTPRRSPCPTPPDHLHLLLVQYHQRIAHSRRHTTSWLSAPINRTTTTSSVWSSVTLSSAYKWRDCTTHFSLFFLRETNCKLFGRLWNQVINSVHINRLRVILFITATLFLPHFGEFLTFFYKFSLNVWWCRRARHCSDAMARLNPISQ